MGARAAGVSFSGRRVWFIAGNTVRAAVRQKVFGFLLLLAAALVLGAQHLRDFHFGSPELKFIADLGFGAIAAFGAVLAIVVTAQLFFQEVERRTVLTLLAQPVTRPEFILGKYFGVAVITGAFCGLLTLVLAGVLHGREIGLRNEGTGVAGDTINYALLAVTGLLQWLKLLLLAALSLLVASYAKTQIFTIMAGFLVGVVCQLRHLICSAGERGHSGIAAVIARGMAKAFPDFQLFDLDASWQDGNSVVWNRFAWLVLYAIGYGSLVLALAAFSFDRREL